MGRNLTRTWTWIVSTVYKWPSPGNWVSDHRGSEISSNRTRLLQATHVAENIPHHFTLINMRLPLHSDLGLRGGHKYIWRIEERVNAAPAALIIMGGLLKVIIVDVDQNHLIWSCNHFWRHIKAQDSRKKRKKKHFLSRTQQEIFWKMKYYYYFLFFYRVFLFCFI